MTVFTFILLGKKYVVTASDFEAATRYMNEIRDGWCSHLRWVPYGDLPNTYALGV